MQKKKEKNIIKGDSLIQWNCEFLSKEMTMIENPWTILQLFLWEAGYTQKAFSVKIGKKVSEINELIKGKRKFTLAWDFLLSKTLGTPQKFWILKQIDYDYQALLIEQWQIENIWSKKAAESDENLSEQGSGQTKWTKNSLEIEKNEKACPAEKVFSSEYKEPKQGKQETDNQENMSTSMSMWVNENNKKTNPHRIDQVFQDF